LTNIGPKTATSFYNNVYIQDKSRFG